MSARGRAGLADESPGLDHHPPLPHPPSLAPSLPRIDALSRLFLRTLFSLSFSLFFFSSSKRTGGRREGKKGGTNYASQRRNKESGKKMSKRIHRLRMYQMEMK